MGKHQHNHPPKVHHNWRPGTVLGRPGMICNCGDGTKHWSMLSEKAFEKRFGMSHSQWCAEWWEKHEKKSSEGPR